MKYKLLKYSLLSLLVMLCGNVFAQDPALTLDFTSQETWDIPTSGSNNKDLAEFTDGTYTIKLQASNNYKLNNGYLILGKKDSYLELPTVDFDVEKIEVVGNSGASAAVKQILTDGNGKQLNCDETTGATGTNTYNLIGDDQKARTYRVVVNSAHNTQITKVNIYKVSAEDTRATTTVTLGDHVTALGLGETMDLHAVVKAGDNVLNAAVTWSVSDETVASVSETGTVTALEAGTTVVKATFAGDADNKESSASFKLTVAKAYTSISDMLNDITTTKTDVVFKFEGLVAVFVNGKYTFVNLNHNNILLYGDELGLEAGQVYNGTVTGQLYTYNGLPEIATSKENVSVTPCDDIIMVDIPMLEDPDLLQNYVNARCDIVNAEYISASGSNLTFKANGKEFTVYNAFKIDVTALEAGKIYNLSGVGSVYKKGETTTYQLYLASFSEVQVAPAEFRDFSAVVNNQEGTLLTNEELVQGTPINFGIAVDQEGNVSRVAADNAQSIATISGTYHSEHGLTGMKVIVAVPGAVKISVGQCTYSSNAIKVTNAAGEEVVTATPATACWKNDRNNVTELIYKGEATTLTITGMGYCPFISVENVNPADLKSDATVTFAAGEAEGAEYVPEAVKAEVGKTITLPVNYTMYVAGKTLTAWSDGQNEYAAGGEFTVPENDVTLTAVFTANEVSLADRTEPVTLKWNFRRDQGAPAVGWEGKEGLVWVAQATVNGKSIDVALPFSTAPGKFNNQNNNDWIQINNGTKFTVPSCKGATISMEAYNDITTTTIDGQSDYTQGKTISYTIAGAAETVDVVIGDGSYYRYIQVVLPVVQQQGGAGKKFENAAGTIAWKVGDETNGTVSESIDGAISSASVSAGNGLTIEKATYFDTEMVKYTPATSNAGNVEEVMIEYRVKAAKGVKFKPTQIDYAAVKVGTDNATYSWSYTVDGVESTITEIEPKADLLRNNGSNSSTAKLMHTETFSVDECEEFTFRFYISKTANNKNICIGNVTISGIANGETVAVEMFSLTATATPEEGGLVNVYPVSDQYEAGSEVTLTATENFGYDFVNWTDAEGTELSAEPKFKYTMNSNAVVKANFKKVNTYELALTIDGTNDYMVTVNPAPVVVDGKNMYEEGTAVQLTANQYEGLVTFTNWSDGETGSSKLVSMTDNIQLTAFYAQADIIAGWDFFKKGGEGRKADFFAQDNDADALSLVNTESGETSGWLDKSTEAAGGYESFKGAAVNWRTGASNGDVGYWHWQTKVNAEAFTDINVQFQMLYNYNAYQTYNVEYSLNGESWTKAGSISMSGAKAEASFNGKLPAEANNQKDLYIRMIADRSSNVDGAASANDGNTLAMFFITGTPKLINDGVAPVLVSTVPADGATGVSATGKIVLTFDERVKIAEGAKGMMAVNNGMAGAWQVEPTVSGKTITFEYKGLEYATSYTFSLAANSVGDLTDNMLAENITLTFTTMARPAVQKGLFDEIIGNVDELLAAIANAEARADKNVRYRIFVKNGTYVIPVKTNNMVAKAEGYEVPECITFIKSGNISLIGESRDGVIITNGIDKSETFAGTYGTTSKYDGIGNSDVLQISGSDYYFQDLTIESGMDDATGRDLAVQDKATRTIYKNTGLRGFQDTWTSNNDYGLYYFEGGYVRGRTDYMCGKGDAFFNGVELRQVAGGYAAVPSKSIKYGFVYKDCVINGEDAVVNYATQEKRTAKQADGNYTLGRPWGQGTPIALFIDTKMNVVPSAIGWNEMSNGWPKRFAEYNSMTSTGTQIDLSGRKKTFGEGHANNPVLTAEEALEAGDLHNMFGEWDPTLLTEQAPAPKNVVLSGNTLTWDNSDYAFCWAIVKDGNVIAFTTEPTYTVDDAKVEWSVRAANEMGGLGEAVVAVKGAEDALNVALNVERYPGMGYGVTEATVDFTEAKAYLGVEEITTDMLSIVNPDGNTISDYAPYDGWFNGEGVAETWGNNTKICVKFYQAISNGKFEICDMNGADEVGKTYSVKWQLQANDKKVIYTINVTFVEKPAPTITFADLNKVDEKTVALTSELGKCYEGLTADVDVAAILTKLGVASLNDVTIYAVQSDGSLDDNYKLGTTDGWRNAAGDWQSWGPDAFFYVKADFALESAQIYQVGGMEEKNTVAEAENPASYTATYAFVKNGSTDAVVLKVTLTYVVPVGIKAVNADMAGKTIYNLRGQKVEKLQKGVNIVNGKKIVK